MILLESWEFKTSCSLRDLQSLIEKLQFAAKCLPADWLFTRRMIACIFGKDNAYGKFDKNSTIKLNNEFQKGIRWRNEFLPDWHGKASFLEINWTRSDVIQLYTDASSVRGYGAFFSGAWFNGRWPNIFSKLKLSIECLEMYAVYLALSAWKEKFFRKKIVINCDNHGAIFAWASLNSKCVGVLEIMRRMIVIAAKINFTFAIKHISGAKNDVADALSRFEMERF